MTSSSDPLRNQLLSSLPPQGLSVLAPHLVETTLQQGSWLHHLGGLVEHVYFPHGGCMISLTGSGDEGNAVETIAIGRDGAVGLTAGLGARTASYGAFVQLGGSAAQISAASFAEAVASSAALHDAVVQHSEIQAAWLHQSVQCIANHSLQCRLCSRLLRARDCIGNAPLALRQADLAAILGVQRTTVSLISKVLQAEGAFRVRHGVITITDAEVLARRACACHGLMKQFIERAYANLPTVYEDCTSS
jgi:CRP-like cAMP-binding protein